MGAAPRRARDPAGARGDDRAAERDSGAHAPAVALPLWLANYMVWHLPWLYDAALRNPNTLLHLEHAMYFLTGLAMWWCVFQDEPHRLGSGARAGYLFAAFVLGSPVGLVMALVPDPIYDFYVEAHHRVWGLEPLEDQQLAGMLMALEQALVFFVVVATGSFASSQRRSGARTSIILRPVRRVAKHRPCRLPSRRAPVAQWTERRTSNPRVAGSNPPGRIKLPANTHSRCLSCSARHTRKRTTTVQRGRLCLGSSQKLAGSGSSLQLAAA